MTITLNYDLSPDARRVRIERRDGVTHIIVLRGGPLSYRPHRVVVPEGKTRLPKGLWRAWAKVVDLYLAIPRRPRATFEVTRHTIRFTEHISTEDGIRSYTWPHAPIVEIRPNRFENGLWIDITGHIKTTLLEDVSMLTIKLVADALNAALAEVSTLPPGELKGEHQPAEADGQHHHQQQE